ncbi:MAG: DUF6048 family protein [Muribaculum sp.]|nr:DUF6048 family protein [Muribaculaceae bacterium]MCM1081617.1 DUF6048 family protein [Muribaculum sp.]
MKTLKFSQIFTILIAATAIVSTLPAAAQRRITPVQTPDPNAPKTAVNGTPTPVQPLIDANGNKLAPRPESVVEQRDMHGHIVLVDTISGREYHDTILVVAPKLVYPRFQAVTVGINFWDLAARAFGQSYGLGSAWAELSIHNWFKPYIEVGIGSANHMPKDESYRYKSATAPFFKIGLNYNFLYNSTPDYSVYVGLRYGMSHFSYLVEDATTSNGYWQEELLLNVPKQTATAGYFEALVGLRVRIFSNISLGWEIKWHSLLHEGTHLNGKPWYIPGFGSRSATFSGAFSISYTLPLHPSKPSPEPPAQ